MKDDSLKKKLKQWGQHLLGIGLKPLLVFSGVVCGVAVVIGAIQIAQNKIPIIFGDLFHILLTLIEYGIVVAIAIVVLALIFKLATWFLGKLLIFLSELGLHQKPFNVVCKTRRSGNEVFVEVTNKEWFIDALKIRIDCHFHYKNEVVREPIEWIGNFDRDGATSIFRRKTSQLHLATIDPINRMYHLHLLGRDLEFPFQHERVLEFHITGFSSAQVAKRTKHTIYHTITIIETIVNGQAEFPIGMQF